MKEQFNQWYNRREDLYVFTTPIKSLMQSSGVDCYWGWYLESGNLEPDRFGYLSNRSSFRKGRLSHDSVDPVQKDPDLSLGKKIIMIKDLFTLFSGDEE